VVHGMLAGAFLSRVLGTAMPGPGVLWLSQSIRFAKPVYVGDELEVSVQITHKSEALRTLVLDTTIRNQEGDPVLTGEAKTMMLQTAEEVPWTEMVAVVTGGSRGIGAATAKALGEKGAKVVVNYRSSEDAARSVVDAIETAGGAALAVQADVAEADQAERLADAALEAYGRVDVVVGSATPEIVRKPFTETSWEELDGYWRTYVRSSYTLSQRLIPGMKERRFGRFVHLLTSAVWGTPPPETSAYVAAKSALWGLTRGMAVELAPFGITVNAVSPSAVLTDQWNGTSDNRRRALTMGIPARRLAGPDEVAAAVVYLAGNEAGYVTGANLPIAGGEVM
jgi:3-oxoacyl-[acyl-carrier protein] reductase